MLAENLLAVSSKKSGNQAKILSGKSWLISRQKSWISDGEAKYQMRLAGFSPSYLCNNTDIDNIRQVSQCLSLQ